MKEFISARIKLTLIYIALTAILLALSSFAAVTAEKRAFDKIQEALADRGQRPRLTQILETRLNEFETNFTRRLFILDAVLLGLASVGAYFLSGKTLKPIAKMIKAQEEFAADASHELKTPLTTIGMEIESVVRSKRNIPPEFKGVFTSIKEELTRMGNIVDGLLVLVREESNVTPKMKVNLSEIAKKCISKVEKRAAIKSLEFKAQIDEGVITFASEENIERLILIFLDNAIKYTPKGIVTVKLTKVGKMARITISDTGLGIPQKDISHIFKRFYRVAGRSSKTQKGAGLGLSIAKKIAEQQGGKISVESRLGKGSTFEIYLPLTP